VKNLISVSASSTAGGMYSVRWKKEINIDCGINSCLDTTLKDRCRNCINIGINGHYIE